VVLRRLAVAASFAVVASAPVACSLLVDTDGLSGDGGDAAGGRDANAERSDASSDANVAPSADAATSRYAAAVQADAPLLYYRFGERSGELARDEVTGTSVPYPAAGFTRGVKGALAGDPDTCISTDGSTGLDLPEGAYFEALLPFSVEAWVNVEPLAAGQNDVGFLVDHEAWSGGRRGWALRVSRSDLGFERWADNSIRNGIAVAEIAMAGTWHHIVATFDGSTQRLYYDGVRRTSGPADVVLPKVGGPFRIAAQNCTPCSGNPFIGSIDELAIYPKALSEARIAAHLSAAR
jgi:hypothetical protein